MKGKGIDFRILFREHHISNVILILCLACVCMYYFREFKVVKRVRLQVYRERRMPVNSSKTRRAPR